MGKLAVAARLVNLDDQFRAERGELTADQVRTVEIPDALVDTGATTLSAPRRVIDALGLKPTRMRNARTSAGVVSVQIYGTVRLTIQGRDCPSDVVELPDDGPALIGQIPLALLDFVVDPGRQRLIGNPEHGGEHVKSTREAPMTSSPRADWLT